MAPERLGIVEERAANRAKYARHRYVAPQDRLWRSGVGAELASRPGIIVRPPPNSSPHGKMAAVMAKFCEVYSEYSDAPYTVATLQAPLRSRSVAWPRHICIYLVREITKLSTTQIGKAFNRDHSSIVHAIHLAPIRIAAEKNLWETHQKVRFFFLQTADDVGMKEAA